MRGTRKDFGIVDSWRFTPFIWINFIMMFSSTQLNAQIGVENRYKYSAERDSTGALPGQLPNSGQSMPEIEKVVYLFSGLGADYRVFQHLPLPGYKKVFIEWLTPEKNESLEHYAGRIKQQITTADPLFVGVSFGGMVAIEVAKLVPVDKMVLISSAKSKAELQARGNFFLRWHLYRVVPSFLLRQSNFMVNYLFGVNQPSDKLLLSQILADTDVQFLRWALDKITTWDNRFMPLQLVHIHGTSDHIIPFEHLAVDYPIIGGGHFMVLNRAVEINRIIINYFGSKKKIN